MTDAPKDNIKRKIAALLAKTRASGCTESEALAAAEAAARLMVAHEIDETDIELTAKLIAAPKHVPKWRYWLLAGVTKATNTAFISCGAPRNIFGIENTFEFVGRPADVEVARYLDIVMTRAIAGALRRAKTSSDFRRLRKRFSKIRYLEAFALGMATRLVAQLKALFAATECGDARLRAEAYLHKRHPGIGTVSVRPRKSSTTNVNGLLAGVAAADSVHLAHGVNGSAGLPLIGGR